MCIAVATHICSCIVILVRTPEEVEALCALAKKHNLRKLQMDGITITRFSRDPKAIEVELTPIEPEPEQPKEEDPLERKRQYYALAFGRVPSDEELTLYPEVP